MQLHFLILALHALTASAAAVGETVTATFIGAIVMIVRGWRVCWGRRHTHAHISIGIAAVMVLSKDRDGD